MSSFNFEKTRRKNFKCEGEWPLPSLIKASFIWFLSFLFSFFSFFIEMARTKVTPNPPPLVDYKALYHWGPDDLLAKTSQITSLKLLMCTRKANLTRIFASSGGSTTCTWSSCLVGKACWTRCFDVSKSKRKAWRPCCWVCVCVF